jgi:hypothetical protein
MTLLTINDWADFCAKYKKELEKCGLVASVIGLEELEVSK